MFGEKLSAIHTDKQGFTASDVSLKKIGWSELIYMTERLKLSCMISLVTLGDFKKNILK